MIAIKRSGQKEERITVMEDRFTGISGIDAPEIKNADIANGGLRVCQGDHEPTLAMPRGIFGAVNIHGRMIVAAGTGGQMTFYAIRGNKGEMGCITAETVSQSARLEDYCASLILTDKPSPQLSATDREGDKLLMFPWGKILCLTDTGIPTKLIDLPTDVPKFDFAVFHEKRLYGTVGNSVYVSGSGGCFHWTKDEENAEKLNPYYAWQGSLSASVEDEQPVTGVVSHQGEVYIFRTNSILRIAGSGNPFRLEHIADIGTFDHQSICSCRGLLYFLSREGAFSFDGRTVKALPPLPEGTVLTGAAGKLNGKYAFYGRYEGRHLLFLYDPQSESYGVRECENEVVSLIEKDGTQYIVYTDSIQRWLSVLSERTNATAEYLFPICDGHLQPCGAVSAAVRGKCKGRASIEAAFRTVSEEGREEEYPLGKIEAVGSDVTFRQRRKLPKASALMLKVKTVGDVTLCGYECTLRLKK